MPFVSEAQRKWMHTNLPDVAKRWEEHTPKGKKLPEHVKKEAFEAGYNKVINQIFTGEGKNKPDSAFRKDQLNKGIQSEKEHTKIKPVAKTIAKDHLSEMPDYYTRLEKMEGKEKQAFWQGFMDKCAAAKVDPKQVQREMIIALLKRRAEREKNEQSSHALLGSLAGAGAGVLGGSMFSGDPMTEAASGVAGTAVGGIIGSKI